MPYDSEATRTRLLDAAYEEFSERGLAGARVDRIATAADANKQAIYAYFGSKEALFDAVLERRLGILADLVPFTPDDLPGYIGAIFDHMVEDPALLRLTLWKTLESTEAGEAEVESHRAKARELARSSQASPERAMDIFMLTLAMAQAWNLTPPPIRGGGRAQAARLKRHREALVTAVSATLEALRG